MAYRVTSYTGFTEGILLSGVLSGFAVPAFIEIQFAYKKSMATTHKCPKALVVCRLSKGKCGKCG